MKFTEKNIYEGELFDFCEISRNSTYIWFAQFSVNDPFRINFENGYFPENFENQIKS